MIDYYNKRVEEYEDIYRRKDPERQAELDRIANRLHELFQGRNVLEAACGTGYWTERVYDHVSSITAIDKAENVIEFAGKKNLPASKVHFQIADVFEMKDVAEHFNGGFANFWFSHIPKKKIGAFLELFHSRLQAGSPVYFADNVYIEGQGGTLENGPDGDDTYKRRTLNNGETYTILKNYYDRDTLHGMFSKVSENVTVEYGKYYWQVYYTL